MESLIARCPAKVNLALKVVDRREDGFHELDTVFQAIDLWDEIRIEPESSQHPQGHAGLRRRLWGARGSRVHARFTPWFTPVFGRHRTLAVVRPEEGHPTD